VGKIPSAGKENVEEGNQKGAGSLYLEMFNPPGGLSGFLRRVHWIKRWKGKRNEDWGEPKERCCGRLPGRGSFSDSRPGCEKRLN